MVKQRFYILWVLKNAGFKDVICLVLFLVCLTDSSLRQAQSVNFYQTIFCR